MTRTPLGKSAGHTERRADEVADATLAWLATETKRPFFLWVHFFDPHDPYEAPPPFAGTHDLPYDDEVAYVDSVLDRLITSVADMSTGDPWVFVTADHGESLGEHGELTHGVFLYESTMHVPLLVIPPSWEGYARSSDSPVSLADVAVTLIDAAGIPGVDRYDGHSLLGIIENVNSRIEPSPLYLESIHGRMRYGWSPLYGYLDWPRKYISAPQPEMYDLSTDAIEAHNRFSAQDHNRFEERLAGVRGQERQTDEHAGIPDQDLERLESLGYLGVSGSRAAPNVIDDHPRPDPKARIACLEALERGLAAMTANRPTEAWRELEAARKLDPDNLIALNNLGILALRNGKLQHAEELFRTGIGLDPHSESLANNLGMTLSRLHRYTEAGVWFERALVSRPEFTAARFNLALAVYRNGKDPARAMRELEQIREEDPDFPDLETTINAVQKSLSPHR
jgi:choline-sulfatase